MASLRKFPNSKFWFACFTMPDGRRVQRSTKLTLRKQAQSRADEFERAAREHRSAVQAQRVIADIFKARTGNALPSATVRAYFGSWLARKRAESAKSSYDSYAGRCSRFLAFLGKEADGPIQNISREMILAFRDEELARVSASSANLGLKILRMVLEDARREGLLADNPATAVKTVRAEKQERRAFTETELATILGHSPDEWRSLVLFGLYTGQRLGDIAQMRWRNLDLDVWEWRFSSGKVGRLMKVPICDALKEHVLTIPSADDPDAFVHPTAGSQVGKAGGRVNTLSRQFGEILAEAGIVPPKPPGHTGKGKGRDARRELSPVSFHSLRHTTTSLLKAAGVSQSIAMDLVGHESAAVNQRYSHTSDEERRKAIQSLPRIH